MHDALSEPHGPAANIVQRLRRRIAEVRSLGFQIRQEFLQGHPSSWCEIGGKKTIFLDSSQPAADQIAALDEAIRSYQPARP
ncbi:MAG: hypothetical protein ACO1RT_15740 [Planctomycetaceae bacterium]